MGVNDLSDRGSYTLLNGLSSLRLITVIADAVDKRVRKTGFADKANIAEFILGWVAEEGPPAKLGWPAGCALPTS